MGDLFGDKLNELFDHMQKKVFSFHMMHDILKCSTELDEDTTFDNGIFKRSVDCLIIAKNEVDIRVFRYYVPVFRFIFMRTDDVESAMTHFYNLDEFKNSAEPIPALRERYPQQKFDADMAVVVTKLHKNEYNSEKEFDQLCKELAFYLTIAPKPAIRTTLAAAVSNPASIPTFLEFLRRVPAFFQLRVPHVYHQERKELLIVSLFRHLICIDYKNQSKKLNTVVEIATQLTSTQPSLEDENEPSFDATEFVHDLIVDLMERVKDNYTVLLNMLIVILPPQTDPNSAYWKIDWVTSDGSNGLKAHDLQNAIYDLYKRDVPFKPKKLIREAYYWLYMRLKADGYPLTNYEHIIYQNFLKETEEKVIEPVKPPPPKKELEQPQEKVELPHEEKEPAKPQEEPAKTQEEPAKPQVEEQNDEVPKIEVQVSVEIEHEKEAEKEEEKAAEKEELPEQPKEEEVIENVSQPQQQTDVVEPLEVKQQEELSDETKEEVKEVEDVSPQQQKNAEEQEEVKSSEELSEMLTEMVKEVEDVLQEQEDANEPAGANAHAKPEGEGLPKKVMALPEGEEGMPKKVMALNEVEIVMQEVMQEPVDSAQFRPDHFPNKPIYMNVKKRRQQKENRQPENWRSIGRSVSELNSTGIGTSSQMARHPGGEHHQGGKRGGGKNRREFIQNRNRNCSAPNAASGSAGPSAGPSPSNEHQPQQQHYMGMGNYYRWQSSHQ